jgi:hypothetical protein
VTVPANYDAVTMSVEPSTLNFAADSIEDATNSIISALNTIGNTLSRLQLSWNGDAASEADDFANQWMSAMTGLFGSDTNPQSGVINQVIIALLTATGNYSSSEESITTMFNQLASAISAGSGDGSDTAPIPAGTDTPDASLSAVAEINWTSVP